MNEGNDHYKAKRYEQAAECYRRAIKINPNNAITHYNLGLALDNLGRYGEAIDSYNTALKLNPNKANTVTATSQCRLTLSRP